MLKQMEILKERVEGILVDKNEGAEKSASVTFNANLFLLELEPAMTKAVAKVVFN